MDDLLHQGITAYKAGKRDEARNIFITVVKQSPDNEYAWDWMYQVSGDDKERLYCLKQILRINPKNEKAKQMLDALAGQDFPFEPAQKNNVMPVVQTETPQKQSDTDLHAQDANLSVNHVESIGSQVPQTDQETTNQSTDAIYQPGDIIGQKYEVYRVLGKGGFGVVYLVYDHEIEDARALKTFHNEFLADAKIRDLFRKEANVLVELERHPYLVRTYFVDEISGRLFIAMEYIPPNEQGINSLADYLQNCLPELSQSLRWAIQICFGMEYAYSKGIRTHRDLKPENIMIAQDGTAKITDFGLAGVLDALLANSTRLTEKSGQFEKTQVGVWLGTPTHMPPEQFDNAASCDERSDIYAFGVMLFQMASGELPFLATPPRDDSREEFMRFGLEMQQLHNEASVLQLNSPIFPIIQRCLEKKPGKRYQSFAQLRSDLEAMLKQQNGEVIKPPQLGKLDAWELSNKGNSLESLGRYEDATRYLDKALEIDPLNAAVLASKGNSLNSLGRYEEAIHYLDKALKIDPRNLSALNNKGNSLRELGRYEEAICFYDKALEIDSRFVLALSNKSGSLHDTGRYEEAIRYCDKSLKIDPHNVVALDSKANSLDGLGRYEEALRYYDKALELDPRNVATLYNKGTCLGSLGRYETAISCFSQTLEIDSHHVLAMYNKGTCLGNLDRHEEAILCYDQALKIDPCHVGALFNKANSLYNLSRKREAVQSYRQFLEIVPAEYTEFVAHARQRIRELEGG